MEIINNISDSLALASEVEVGEVFLYCNEVYLVVEAEEEEDKAFINLNTSYSAPCKTWGFYDESVQVVSARLTISNYR